MTHTLSRSIEAITSNVNLAHLHLLGGYEDLDGAIARMSACVIEASCYGYDPRLAYALDDLHESIRRHPDVTEYDRARAQEIANVYAKREQRHYVI